MLAAILALWLCTAEYSMHLGWCLAEDSRSENVQAGQSDGSPEGYEAARPPDPYCSALEKLRAFGFVLDESMIARPDLSLFRNSGIPEEVMASLAAMYNSEEYIMYATLLRMGSGKYSLFTGSWKPTSNQVYSFDAEVYDIGHMYTDFLRGVDAIVPEVKFTRIREDLSGLTDELTPVNGNESLYTDGERRVSFRCGLHVHSVAVASYGDWIDLDTIMNYMNLVLQEEGCPKRLCTVSQSYDQMVIVIYDTVERAERLRTMIDYLAAAARRN